MQKLYLVFLISLVLSGRVQAQSMSDLFNEMKSVPTAIEKEAKLVQLKKLDASSAIGESNSAVVAGAVFVVASSFVEEGNFDRAQFWADQITDARYRQAFVFQLAEETLSKGDLDRAYVALFPEISRLGLTDEDSMNKLSGFDVLYALLFGQLLYQQGDMDRALIYLKPAFQTLTFPVVSYRELYVQALLQMKVTDSPQRKIEEVFLSEGQRSEQFKTAVRKWYVAKDGDESRFLQLVKQAAEQEHIRMKDKVLKMTFNHPAPDFKLRDFNGHEVSLTSLRGKTIIIDFWATWCQPCVASFPGMQRAVDYFKDDDEVAFLFVHTAEKKNAAAIDEAKALITQKGYRFDVYMDLRNTDGLNPVMDAFQVRALPTKFVINKAGEIRFKHTGFVAEMEAVEEIKMMVQLANEK